MHMLSSTTEIFHQAHADLGDFEKIIDFIGAKNFVHEARLRTTIDCDKRDYGDEMPLPDIERRSDLLCMQAWCALNDFGILIRYIQSSTDSRYKGKKPHIATSSHLFATALFKIAWDLDLLHPFRKRRKGWEAQPSALDPSGQLVGHIDYIPCSCSCSSLVHPLSALAS